MSCVLVGVFALSVAPVRAAVTHEYLSRITEVPPVGAHGETVAVPGRLSIIDSLTGDAGNVWAAERVTEQEISRVDEFNASSGAFVTQLPQVPGLNQLDFGVAVGHATGEAETYVAGEDSSGGVVAVFGASGGFQEKWSGADTSGKAFGCFECANSFVRAPVLAVDNSTGLGDWAQGDVYVAAPVDNVVDVFKPEAGGKEKLTAELTGTSATEPFSELHGVAVSAFNGEVFVVDGGGVEIFKPAPLSGQYEFTGKLAGPPPSGSFGQIRSLTVDGSNGDIYVAEGNVVDEFDSTGAFLFQLTGERTPPGNFDSVESVAVDPLTHRVFVGDYRGNEGGRSTVSFGVLDVFGPKIVVPDVTTGAASNVKPASATLNGTVNPDSEGAATCRFAWGKTTALDETASCSASVPDGASPVPVTAAIGGLQPDTTYYYRLQATDANGTNFGAVSQVQEFTTSGPGIHELWASNVASSSATLDAKIDPHGVPVTYYFQYGASAAYGSDVPAAPGSSIGSGQGDVEVSRHLQGLSASTIYHYRVVAVSEPSPGVFEVFDGPDQTLLTESVPGAFALPDGRAWEMVSPPDKQGSSLLGAPREGGIAQAADGGGAITYIANAATEADPPGITPPQSTQLFSSRAASGWSTRVIATPHSAPSGIIPGHLSEYILFSSDLSLGLVEPMGGTPLSEETSEVTPYLRHDAICATSPATCYQPLVNAGNVPPGTKFDEGKNNTDPTGEVKFVGASPDMSHVVLASPADLTTTPVIKTSFASGLYEWTAGKLQLASFLPGNEGGAPVDGGLAGNRHAVSNDGSRIVWTHNSGLYMRDMVKEETVRLDVVESGAQGGNGNVVFQTASSDGSRIFFIDSRPLTVGSSSSGADLYEFDVETRKLTDLTVDPNPNEPAEVQGLVLGAGEDGSYIYFVATGALASGATPGGYNLYVRHAGTTTLIATLSSEDVNLNGGGTWSSNYFVEAGLSQLTARVSPNGKWLAFMSEASLTGYDNRDATSGVRDEEVFLYDASTTRLSCASCNPTRARPLGAFDEGFPGPLFDHPRVWPGRWLAAAVPGWIKYNLGEAMYQSRYLSDSGRLFFDSSDALTPRDTNGAWDVYQYEPAGTGDCAQASASFSTASDGCIGLISSGGATEESVFVDASENGDEVFFLTSAQLLPQDFDHSLDLYDARVCTSSSPCVAVPPVAPPVCSTGDSCKAAPALQPENFGAPSSETFSGAGNLSASGVVPKGEAKSLTRAQRLSRALRECRRKKIERKRAACVLHARRLYAKTAVGKPAAHKSLSVRTGR